MKIGIMGWEGQIDEEKGKEVASNSSEYDPPEDDPHFPLSKKRTIKLTYPFSRDWRMNV